MRSSRSGAAARRRAAGAAALLSLSSPPPLALVDGLSLPRRRFLRRAAAAALGSAASLPNNFLPDSKFADPANAACLPGDLSADCIGVYKLPYMDAKDSQWINDKETLELFAPDIRYVKTDELPATVPLARAQLVEQRKKIKEIREVVFEGDLTEAGVKILNFLPKVTAAGERVRQHVEKNTDYGDKKSERNINAFNESLDEVIAQWSSIDVGIGQALRGQRGVTAVAQIELLGDLKEATAALDDFIRLVELNTMAMK